MSQTLPVFTVTGIEKQRAGPASGEIAVHGRLSKLQGVTDPRGTLLVLDGVSYVGDLVALPSDPLDPVTFVTSPDPGAPPLAVGQQWPWLDGFWGPHHVAMILATNGGWERREFAPSPGQYFRLNGITGWRPVGGTLPEGAEDLGVRNDAWDHEHCEICNARIGASGAPVGFADGDGNWLCGRCHSTYAMPRDLSFVVLER